MRRLVVGVRRLVHKVFGWRVRIDMFSCLFIFGGRAKTDLFTFSIFAGQVWTDLLAYLFSLSGRVGARSVCALVHRWGVGGD